METREGTPTNVVFGISKLIETLKRKDPAYIVFAFDSPGDTFRHEIYPEYKANREEAPPEFKTQIPLVFKLLECHRIPVLAKPGYEADDIIATIVKYVHKHHPDMNVYIESKDKDLYQLLTNSTSLIDISSNSYFTPDELEKKWGIKPSQVKEFLMLTGDSSDNIPGIPGIGPKTATKLLTEYGTIDNLLENIEEINGNTFVYLSVVKKVKSGKLYALIEFSHGRYLVEYELKDGKVKKLKDTKMDAYKFDFETDSVILFDDVDDTEWWESLGSEIIERINALLD